MVTDVSTHEKPGYCAACPVWLGRIKSWVAWDGRRYCMLCVGAAVEIARSWRS